MNPDIAAQHAFDRLKRVGFDALTEREKTVATVWLFDAGVSNGCLEDYYGSKDGNLAFYAPQAFRNIGAASLAEIVEQANRLFGPEGPSKDQATRQEQLRGLSTSVKRELEALDDQYYNAETDADALLEKYVSQN